MGWRLLTIWAVLAFVLYPAHAQAASAALCLLPFTDARPVKTPASVPFRVRAENTPEPIRAHPADGLAEVRRVVLNALRAAGGVEVLDLAGADLKRISADPRIGRCGVLVGGAVFHYEGTVAVDIYGSKIYSGLVGYELVAADARRGRRLMPPVVFAGRRQSEPVRAEEEFGSSDRQVFESWIAEALKIASASLPSRFVRPAASAAQRAVP
jgi:hypothetical protein